MTSPVLTPRCGPDRPGYRRVRRPDWSTVPVGGRSNTSGHGAVLRPAPAVLAERRERVCLRERTFENRGRWWRIRRRIGLVLTSPGVVLIVGSASVLMLGLSPLLTDPGTTGPGPSAGMVSPVEEAGPVAPWSSVTVPQGR